jgi:plastocyanin
MSKRSGDPIASDPRSIYKPMARSPNWAVLVVAVLLAIGMPAAGRAQEASPVSAACDAPPLPPGTPTTMEEMGSPEVGTSGEGTAAAEAPAATVEPAGTPAEKATTERTISAAENLIGCLSSADALGFAALVTPNYLLTEYGMTNPYDMEYVFDGMPPFELLAVEAAQTHADGRTSFEVTTVIGGSQVDHFRAYFVEGEQGYLLLDKEVSLSVPADTTVAVTMLDYSFEMSQTTVPSDTLIAFEIENAGEYPHEFVVVRLPEGISVEDALTDPALDESVVFLGGAFAEPGGVAYMGLTGLQPGTYTVVCFVDTPEGIPHVMRGMVAELTFE